MRLFIFYIRYSPRMVAAITALSVVAGASSALLMASITSVLSRPGRLSFTVSVPGFVGLVLLGLLSNYAARVLMLYFANRLAFDARMHLCERLVQTPLRSVEEVEEGKIFTTLTEDVSRFVGVFAQFPGFLVNVATLLACFVYLGWLSPLVLGLSAAYSALAMVSWVVPEAVAVRWLKSARKDWDVLVRHLRSLTLGIKMLKLHGARRAAFFDQALYRGAAEYERDSFRADHLYSALKSWTQAVYFIFIGVVLFALPGLGHGDPHVMIGYTLTALYMRAPVMSVIDVLPSFTHARIYIERLERLGFSLADFHRDKAGRAARRARAVGAAPAEAAAAAAVPAARGCERLELVGCTYTYYREDEEREFTLGPLNLSIRAGELAFLVGGNGSGKTTLAKVLCGLYAPESGEIRLDGRPVTDENREWYQQHFSAIFSDGFLFERLYGLSAPGAGLDAEANRGLERFGLARKVSVTEGAFSTTRLSHGQRKRLALLTACLEDRPVYIFDEWAAEQSPSFKDFFYLRLLPELVARRKVVLVITHDDRYYHLADHLIRLDSGRQECDEHFAHDPEGAGRLEPAEPARADI
jgi:putative ATP-binding cassette transporter